MGAVSTDRSGRQLLLILAPVLLAMAAYQGALGAGLVFDDHLFLKQWCWQIDDWSELIDVLGRPACEYRRVRYLSMAVDHLLWGTEPFGYHLSNVLLHGLVTGLVVLLLRRLGLGLVPASLAALLWALHPVHTDAVTYVAGRRDLLSTALFLGSALVWPATWKSRAAAGVRVALAIVLFGLAFETKEMAITLPVVVALMLMFRDSLRGAQEGQAFGRLFGRLAALGRGQLAALTVGLGLAGAAFVYRAVLFPMTRATDRLWGGDLLHHLLTIPVAYAKYAQMLLAPIGLYGDYSDYPPATGFGDPRVWLGLVVLGLVWGGGIWLSGRRPYLSLGLLWLGVTMLPVSQIVPHHELLAEHYLYLPLVGLAIPVARAIELGLQRDRWRRLVPVAVSVVAVSWALLVGLRNRDFRDEETFARVVLAHVPDSIRGHLTLAHAQQQSGDLEGALASLQFAAARAQPGTRFHHSALRNTLVTLSAAGALEAAEFQAFEMLRNYPGDAYAQRILGTIRARQGLPNKALVYQLRAFESEPEDVEGRLHLGITLMRLGRLDEAAPHLAFAAERWHRNADAQLQWALVAYEQGRSEDAQRRLERVVALDPTNVYALERLFLLAQQAGDGTEACRWFERLRPLRDDLRDVDLACPPSP